MVVIKVLIEGFDKDEFGAHIYENNYDGECVVHDDHHCRADVDGFDTIFGSNDKNITMKIPLVEMLADQVVNNIRSRGEGNTYDDELADEYTNDVLVPFAKYISDLAHDIMKKKYTTTDGLTIIGDEIMNCPHKCGACIGTDEYGVGCMHGCHDCGHWDGSTCLNGACSRCGHDTYECACDCNEWEGA